MTGAATGRAGRGGWGQTQRRLLTALSASTRPLTTAQACAAAGIGAYTTAYPSLCGLEATGLVAKVPAPPGPPGRTRIAWLITDAGRARTAQPAPVAPDMAVALAWVIWTPIQWGAELITEPAIESWLHEEDVEAHPGLVREALAWLAGDPRALVAAGPEGWRLTARGRAVCGMPEAEWAGPWLCLDLLDGWSAGETGMSGRAAAGIAEWAGLGDIGTRQLGGYQDAWIIAGDSREVTWSRLPGSDSRYLFTIRGQQPDGTWATAYETIVLELGDVAYATREIIGSRSADAPIVWKPGGFFQANTGGQDPDYSAVRQRLADIIAGRAGAADASPAQTVAAGTAL